ncbi:MAG: response regulator [Lentisphaerae bacterium]|nr:response regulator [Lentisphaerota bacterium]
MRMNHGCGHPHLAACGTALTVLVLFACPVRADAYRNVLILNAYHAGYAWADETIEGIRSMLNQSGISLRIYTEFMDTKRHAPADIYPELENFCRAKYAKDPPALIIACDNNALDFILTRRERLFPGCPVVFCGINNYDPSMIAGHTGITGVAERYNIEATLAAALRLQPQLRYMAVISDATVTGDQILRGYRIAMPRFRDRITFEEFVNLPPETLARKLRDMPKEHAAVLFLQYMRDPDGRHISMQEGLALVVDNAAVPVYSAWDIHIPYGIVGGVVTSARLQGATAAAMAARILKGEPVSRIPVILDNPTRPVFNYNQLQRFHMPLSRLPAGSRVVNKPTSIFHRYRKYVLITLLFVLAQSLALLLLAITVRRRRAVERDLRRKEAFNFALFQYNPVETVVVDRDGRVVRSNLARLRSGDRPIHNGDAMYVDYAGNHTIDMRGELMEAIRSGKPKDFPELPYHNRFLSVTIAPFSEGAIIISTDITARLRAEQDRRRLEAQMQRTQKLESLGILAGGIAHDFNNLLMSMLGNAEIALMDLPGAAAARKHIEAIESSAKQAADLCRQLLAYSGKGRFLIEPLDLSAVVEDTHDLLNVLIPKKVTVRYALEHNLPPVEGDSSQIRQVLINLMTNAAEAIGDANGVITVSSGRLTLTAADCSHLYLGEQHPAGEYVYLDVADTGCGMDAETRARIFDPFFTTKFTGRGLGLAAVIGIMRSHKGDLRVETAPGQGTRVTLYFPPTQRAVDAAAEPAPVPAWSGSGTVLLADDEEAVRNVASTMLERLGFSVITATNGAEAVERFRAHRGDIVLTVLDVTMPVMDGHEALRQIREIQTDAVVLLSSGYEEDTTGQRIHNGRAGFVHKPYRLAELRAQIAAALDAA